MLQCTIFLVIKSHLPRKSEGWDSVPVTLNSQVPAWPRMEEKDKVEKWHHYMAMNLPKATQTDSINTCYTSDTKLPLPQCRRLGGVLTGVLTA